MDTFIFLETNLTLIRLFCTGWKFLRSLQISAFWRGIHFIVSKFVVANSKDNLENCAF